MKNVNPRDALFLAEMGIGPLWQLRSAAVAEAEAQIDASQAPDVQAPAAEAQTPVEPQPVAAPAPRAHTPLSAPPYRNPPPEASSASAWDDSVALEAATPDVGSMDWPALRAAIASCKHCSACGEGRKAMVGSGPRQARWLVAAGTVSAIDEQAGSPLSGDPGKLFDNMLHAVGLSRERDVYITPLVKCRPTNAKGGDRAPSADEVAACRPFLERELALSGASTVLTLGQIAANGLLERPLQEPLASLRGQTHRLNDKPLVATLHPGELLRRGADKALAWADLCRARSLDGGH